jgi:hypothetical protein
MTVVRTVTICGNGLGLERSNDRHTCLVVKDHRDRIDALERWLDSFHMEQAVSLSRIGHTVTNTANGEVSTYLAMFKRISG